MIFIAYTLEIIGYIIKTFLIISFWLIVLNTTFNWLKLSNNSKIVRVTRFLVEPIISYLKRKIPFLESPGFNIDFTPILVVFIIILLHLTIVNTLLDAAFRLK